MHIDAPSERMKTCFMVAAVIMLLHKVECWVTEEWAVSPFFQAMMHSSYWEGKPPEAVLGEAMFLTFVVWLFVGLTLAWMAMKSPRGATVALGLWGLTFVLEWHHVVRSVLAGAYYSGLISAVVYLAFGWGIYLREWRKHVHLAGPSA